LSVKLTYEFVKSKFEERGYKLLSKEYVNANTLLQYQCPHHPDKELWMRYSNFSKGKGCPYCAGNGRISPDEALERLKDSRYDVIDGFYKNAQSMFTVRCKVNPEHIWRTSYNSLVKHIYGCPHCAGNARTSQDKAIQELKDSRYEVIDGIYKNIYSVFTLRCKSNPDHVWEASYTALVHNKTGCPECWYRSCVGENNPNWRGGKDLTCSLRDLLDAWKYEAFNTQNRTCYISGAKGSKLSMQVHHSENFYKIRDKILKELGYVYKRGVKRIDFTEEEFDIIKTKLIEKHEDLPGIVMTENIHKLFHSIYGKKNNSMQQVEEFKQRYKAGEFGELK
jgi:hypothetical protein